MRKKLATCVLFTAFSLLLTSCVMENQQDASSQTASSAVVAGTTGTTIYDDLASVLRFSTLEEYKETLLTMTDSETIHQALKESGEVSYDENDFEMLLVDRYLLLPVLPEGAFLLRAEFTGDGASGFTIQLSNGVTVYFEYWHNKRERDKIENAETRTWTNARGISVLDERVPSSTLGYYTWKEGEYSCLMPYRAEDGSAYELVLNELSFEKVPLDAA